MADEDEDGDDTWSDTFEDPQSRFQDLDATPKNTLGRRMQMVPASEDESGDRTPVEGHIRAGSPMHDLVAAAAKLNESRQKSPNDPIREKAGASVGMYPARRRSGSVASTRSGAPAIPSRPASRGPNPIKKRPAPAIPQAAAAVVPSPVPLRYPSRGLSRPTSPAFDLEKASSAEKSHFSANYPLNTYLPGSRPGSRMASASRDSTPSGSSNSQPIQIKETPMKIWNPPRTSILHEPTAPRPEEVEQGVNEESSTGASGSTLAAPGDTSRMSASPSKCPHCTIHSWLPHSQNCPKWKGLRKK